MQSQKGPSDYKSVEQIAFPSLDTLPCSKQSHSVSLQMPELPASRGSFTSHRPGMLAVLHAALGLAPSLHESCPRHGPSRRERETKALIQIYGGAVRGGLKKTATFVLGFLLGECGVEEQAQQRHGRRK